MIVHEINVYQKKEWTQPSYPYQYNHRRPTFHSFPKEMSKLEYALYIANLPYKKGDLVVGKYVSLPYLTQEVFQVEEIAEIHRFVQFGPADLGPKCIVLKDVGGQILQGYSGAATWKKVEPHNYPTQWREVLS